MLFNIWPSAESLNRIHDHWEEYYSDPANRHERTHSFLGVKIVSGPVHPFDVFKWGAGKDITIPERPSFLQKLVAFLLIQLCFAEFARRENQWIGYAFRWNNAREIFSW